MSMIAVSVGAIAIFLGAFAVLNAEALVSLVAAGAGLAGMLILRRRLRASGKGRPGRSGRSGSGGQATLRVDLSGLSITPEEFDRALREGALKLARLKAASERIADQRVRGKAYAICDAVARILTTIREDPKDLRPARKFLDYYLESTIKVIDRYGALSGKAVITPELAATLARVEASLDTIQTAYDRQLTQLLENDVMDLDIELDVLERTIRMEGLGD